MRTIAILPVKSFGAAKQRLGELLAGGSRRALAQAMFADVLTALRHVPELDEVAVVTGDRAAEWAARAERVLVLPDPAEDGQSAAAQIGVRHALAQGFDRALLVPGDAPLLDPAELSALLERDERRRRRSSPTVTAPAPTRCCSRPPTPSSPSFGPDSLARHVAGAEAAGVEFSVDELPSLTLDVDTPGDLAEVARRLESRRGLAPQTRGALSQLGRMGALPGAGARERLSDFSVHVVGGLPEVAAGDDLAAAAGRRRRLRGRRRPGGRAQGRVQGRGAGARAGLGRAGRARPGAGRRARQGPAAGAGGARRDRRRCCAPTTACSSARPTTG